MSPRAGRAGRGRAGRGVCWARARAPKVLWPRRRPGKSSSSVHVYGHFAGVIESAVGPGRECASAALATLGSWGVAEERLRRAFPGIFGGVCARVVGGRAGGLGCSSRLESLGRTRGTLGRVYVDGERVTAVLVGGRVDAGLEKLVELGVGGAGTRPALSWAV